MDHLISNWQNKGEPDTRLGPNRDTPAMANVKRFTMGYKEGARITLLITHTGSHAEER